MDELRRPFYGPVRRRGVFIQSQLVETTQPGATWISYAPTGKLRAFFFGLRIPMRVAWWLVTVYRARQVALAAQGNG